MKLKDGSTLIARQVSSIFSRMTIADLGIDIQLGLDKRIYVTLNPSLQGKVSGLCGNYNNKQIDDFTTSSGVNAKANINKFGNSWKVSLHCGDVEEKNLRPCDLKSQQRPLAEEICRKLREEPFASCNQEIPVDKYVEQCEQDVCGCPPSDKECQCLAFATYARECSVAGFDFLWRGLHNCPIKCPVGQVYKMCGSNCHVNCKDFLTQQPCHEECVEGCQCPEDKVRDDESGQCVKVDYCPCIVDGIVYQSHQSWKKGCNDCFCSSGTHTCTELDCSTYETCADGMEWIPCLQCERTCQSANKACSIRSGCTPGCGCPKGLVLHKGSCIDVSDCTCEYNDKSYKPFDTTAMDCHTCMCHTDYRWICDEDQCPSTCRSYGESHFQTLDAKWYSFQGNCEYTLVENFCGGSNVEGFFRVTIENVPCGRNGVTCTKAVKFTLHDTTIHLVRGAEYTVAKDPRVTTKARFKMEDAGLFLVIKTAEGILLKWDYGTSVLVTLDPSHAGQVCGLCGNFNGDSSDDFYTRSGAMESSPQLFGRSWRTSENCPDPKELTLPCKSEPHRRAWAESVCSIIKKSIFASCHNLVDSEPFFQACVSDTCFCDRGADCECMCTAVTAYATACNENNVAIAWRAEGYCRQGQGK
ncbi:von Willebrand factor-like [Asterias rubens]|uniref:von Willebrand factor-like n=1 Tax=Asterias rubens TaxID=7604 RepID=UPI0014552766|nr:von Willebrand factor-like [Asterias rubens]